MLDFESHITKPSASTNTPIAKAPMMTWWALVSIVRSSWLSLGRRRARVRVRHRGMLRRSPARPLEIFLHPRLVEALDLVERIGDQHALLRDRRDAVADRVQRIEIVRDQEHREAEAF